jgi:hypothetical protein
MPFVWSLRKLVAPLVLRRYLSRFVGAVVPGERPAAYRRYRARVSDPWGLTCCGMGPEAGRLRGVEGGMPLAAPYAKEVWAERVRGIGTQAARQSLRE